MADKVADVLVGAYWTVDVQGKTIGIFSSLEGGTSKNKTVEHRYVNAKGQPLVRMEAGPREYTPIKLTRGITGNPDFAKWRKLVEDGKYDQARINCSIRTMTQDGTEVSRANYTNAMPIEITTTKLDAKSNEAVMETITLIYEDVEFLFTGQTQMA
jgi:phage tail-like protein